MVVFLVFVVSVYGSQSPRRGARMLKSEGFGGNTVHSKTLILVLELFGIQEI